jgi:SAM-dependent methyltransferase
MPDEKNVAPAFDAVAAGYDRGFSDTLVGKAQRNRVWHFLKPFLQNEAIKNVLECNCGTGVDACWLAEQGITVMATDVSSEMVAITRARVEAAGLSGLVQTSVSSWQEIHGSANILPSAPYQFLFSDFGGLNCIAPAEIRQWNTDVQEILTPDSWLGVVVMSRFTWWETFYFILKGKPRAAFRRWSRKPVEARLDAATTISTWYYTPGELASLLPDFEVKNCFPIGFWLPPSYLDPFFQRRKGFLRVLNWLEKKSAARYLAPAADHYFLLLKRKD